MKHAKTILIMHKHKAKPKSGQRIDSSIKLSRSTSLRAQLAP